MLYNLHNIMYIIKSNTGGYLSTGYQSVFPIAMVIASVHGNITIAINIPELDSKP